MAQWQPPDWYSARNPIQILTANSHDLAGGDVTILAGDVVVVDIAIPVLNTIVVNGTLILKNLGTPQNIAVSLLFISRSTPILI